MSERAETTVGNEQPSQGQETSSASTIAARIVSHLEAAIGGEDPAANVVLALRLLLQELVEFMRTATAADVDLLRARFIMAEEVLAAG